MTSKLSFKASLLAGLLAGGVAAAINAVLFFIFHAMSVIKDDVFVQPNQPLTVMPVLMSSIMPAIIGSILFFALEKFTNSGFKIFSYIAIPFLILSLVGPFTGIVGISTAYAVVLDVMHIVVAISVLYFINRRIQTAK
jgi:Family of unknown function (DUF6069)